MIKKLKNIAYGLLLTIGLLNGVADKVHAQGLEPAVTTSQIQSVSQLPAPYNSSPPGTIVGVPCGAVTGVPTAIGSQPCNSVSNISTTGGMLTLTQSQYANAQILLTGTLTSTLTVNFPASTIASWRVINNTTGAFGAVAQIPGQATPLNIPQGQPRDVSSVDGANLVSPVSQATGLTTPTTTVTGDLVTWGGINGQSIIDSGYTIGTSGGSVPLMSGNNTWTGAQTFSGATNIPVVGSMLVNGDMDIDQLNEGASNSTGIDRWQYHCGTCSSLTLQRVTTSPPIGYVHSLLMTASATPVTPSAGDVRVLRSPVEGSQVSALGWGTATAQSATLVLEGEWSVAGTYAVAIANSGSSYCYVTTITVPTANVWQSVTLSILAPPNGSAWSSFVANQYGLQINFDLGSGSTFATSTLNTWQTGTYWTATGATALVSNASATMKITGVHLFAGSNVNGYVPRPYGQELALAKRYRLKTFPEGTVPAQNAGLAGALCTKVPVATSYASVYLQTPLDFYVGTGSAKASTTYNPSAANANWRDVTAAADVTVSVDPSNAFSGSGIEIATGATVANAGDNLCIHAYLDSGFN